MELELVTIRHPNPEVADSRVPASAVDHWRGLGWLTETEYAEHEAAQAEQAKAGTPAEEPTKKAATRTRRGSEEKD